MSTGDLLPLDRAQLLRDIEAQALRDSQSDWSGVAAADVPPGPVHREVDRWADQRSARIAAARSADEQIARARIREAEAAETAADEQRARADDVVAEAVQRRAGLEAVLRGERPGNDGGDWSDPGRMSEDRRRQEWIDRLVYLAAAGAEVGLNFLAFRLMGAGPVETALLAAAVVLVTVLLPKQLGGLVAVARRTGVRTGGTLVLIAVAVVLWGGVNVFVAVVRTSYLLLPIGSAGQPLLVQAGLGPLVLTAGWFAVAMAVGLAVLLRSMHRHNPYASAWHAATVQIGRSAGVRTAARRAAGQAAERAARERDTLGAVGDRYAPLEAETRALAAELKEHYGRALGRRRTSVEQRTLNAVPRPVLEPPEDGAAA